MCIRLEFQPHIIQNTLKNFEYYEYIRLVFWYSLCVLSQLGCYYMYVCVCGERNEGGKEWRWNDLLRCSLVIIILFQTFPMWCKWRIESQIH